MQIIFIRLGAKYLLYFDKRVALGTGDKLIYHFLPCRHYDDGWQRCYWRASFDYILRDVLAA